MAEPLNLKAIAHALDRVESVGQAQAAVQSAIADFDAMHTTIRAAVSFFSNPFEGFSYSSVDRAVEQVRRLSREMKGLPTARVRYGPPLRKEEPTWANLHRALLHLYGELYAVQQHEPSFTWRDAVSNLQQSINEAPAVFVRGVRAVAKATGEVAAGVAGAGGSVAWALIKPLLPVILGAVAIVAVVAVVGSTVKGKVA